MLERPKIRVSMVGFPRFPRSFVPVVFSGLLMFGVRRKMRRTSEAGHWSVVESRRSGPQLAERHHQLQRRNLDAGQMRQRQGRVEQTVYLHRPAKLQIL